MATCMVLLMLMLIIFIGFNDAMIDKFRHLKIGFEVRSIHQFKFDKGGNLELNGDIIDEKKQKSQTIESDEDETDTFALNLYHCTDKEIESLNKYNSMHKLCANIDEFECLYSYHINAQNKYDPITYSFHSLHKQWMTMVIISCSPHKMYDISSLNLVSKSGSTTSSKQEYLSLNEINYKYIFLCLSIAYLLLFFIYFIHLFPYRYFNISIQILLLFYPFLQCLSCVFTHLFWTFSSRNGIKNNYYLIVSYIASALCNGLLALILLFICCGWEFMNNSLKNYKTKIKICLICTFIIICSFLQNYYSSMLLFSCLCYVLCFGQMLKAYNKNMILLQSQIEILDDANYNDYNGRSSPAQIKKNMLTLFKKGMIAFIALGISFYFLSSLLLFEYPWINDIILNVLVIFFSIFLFYNFRMSRTFKPYFYLIDEDIADWIRSKDAVINEIDYNLNFEADSLIVENGMDYLLQQQDVIKSYSLCRPFTIDLKQEKQEKKDIEYSDENTPLLLK